MHDNIILDFIRCIIFLQFLLFILKKKKIYTTLYDDGCMLLPNI